MIGLLTFFAIIEVVTLEDYNISSSDYLLGLMELLPVLNTVNLFDGPLSVSNATTTPSTTLKPTYDQMKYFNYYAASMYCAYELDNLDCVYCQKFKDDIDEHAVLKSNVHNTLALITLSKKRKEIVVTYRGSNNAWNAILDVLMINGGKDEIKLHRGFYIAAMSLYEDVVINVGYLREVYGSDYKIVIVGHSLGGSMARVTEYFLHSLNQFPGATYEVYTYGEPRSGNKAYADYLNSLQLTTARVVARADVAAHVVPTSVLSLIYLDDAFVHVQTEYWINGENGTRFCNQRTYEDPTCSNSLGPLYTIVDHLTYFDANYLTCMAENPLTIPALPFNLLEPTEILPPLPKPIKNFIGGSTNFALSLLSPILGR